MLYRPTFKMPGQRNHIHLVLTRTQPFQPDAPGVDGVQVIGAYYSTEEAQIKKETVVHEFAIWELSQSAETMGGHLPQRGYRINQKGQSTFTVWIENIHVEFMKGSHSPPSRDDNDDEQRSFAWHTAGMSQPVDRRSVLERLLEGKPKPPQKSRYSRGKPRDLDSVELSFA